MYARYADQVGGDNLDIQRYFTQESLRGTKFMDHAMAGVWRTHGYPRQYVGGTVERLCGRQPLLEKS